MGTFKNFALVREGTGMMLHRPALNRPPDSTPANGIRAASESERPAAGLQPPARTAHRHEPGPIRPTFLPSPSAVGEGLGVRGQWSTNALSLSQVSTSTARAYGINAGGLAVRAQR